MGTSPRPTTDGNASTRGRSGTDSPDAPKKAEDCRSRAFRAVNRSTSSARRETNTLLEQLQHLEHNRANSSAFDDADHPLGDGAADVWITLAGAWPGVVD